MQRLRPLRCATLLVILLAGCAAPCAPSRTEAVVLPMGRGSYYLFHDGAAELCRGQDARLQGGEDNHHYVKKREKDEHGLKVG